MPKRLLFLAILLCLVSPSFAQTPTQSEMDRDLFEVTIPQLESFYASHKYTVTQVVQWHLARIHRYNAIYRAVQTLDARGALETAAAEDADAAKSGNGL